MFVVPLVGESAHCWSQVLTNLGDRTSGPHGSRTCFYPISDKLRQHIILVPYHQITVQKYFVKVGQATGKLDPNSWLFKYCMSMSDGRLLFPRKSAG